MSYRWAWVWALLIGCSGGRGPAVPPVLDGREPSAASAPAAPAAPNPREESKTATERSADQEPPAANRDGSDAGHMPADGGPVTLDSRPLAARICPATPIDPSPTTVASVAARVRAGFGFLEGPVWLDSQAALLFSDMDFASTDAQGPRSRIWRFDPPDAFAVFVKDANSNGLAIDGEGFLLACTHDIQSLSRFDPATGARTPLELTWRGRHFNSPNDLVARSDGNVYFTDPDWQLGTRSSETGTTGVYRVTPQRDVQLITDRLEQPNGIALSPDERTLYVGSAGSDVMRYDVMDDGSVRGDSGKVFASPGASDGMTVDCGGNVYVTAGGSVQVFSPAGAALDTIDVPDQPSNVAFGGSDHKTLYITAGPALYAIGRDIPGLPY